MNKFINIELTKSNVILFAMANYDNPHCLGIKEFREDYRLYKKLDRSLSKDNIKESLNTIIILNNIFGIDAMVKLIDYFIGIDNIQMCNAILVFLQFVDAESVTYDKYLYHQLKGI